MPGTETSGFAQLSDAQRILTGAIGGLTRWSRVNSPAARTEALAPARAGRQRAWERQADPDGVLTPTELAAAVERLKKAHQARMTLASAQARSARTRRAA